MLKKKNIMQEQYQSNLILNEICKTKDLIEKIDVILSENSNSSDNISAGIFKNSKKLLSTLNNQKDIAKNKKEFLENQKLQFDIKIAKTNSEKKLVKEKYKFEHRILQDELETKKNIYFNKKRN